MRKNEEKKLPGRFLSFCFPECCSGGFACLPLELPSFFLCFFAGGRSTPFSYLFSMSFLFFFFFEVEVSPGRAASFWEKIERFRDKDDPECDDEEDDEDDEDEDVELHRRQLMMSSGRSLLIQQRGPLP